MPEPDRQLETDLAASPKPTLKFNRKSFLYLAMTFGAILGGVSFIKVPIACSCGNPALSITGAFVRGQQAYFEEYKVFGKSLQELDLGNLPAQTTRYDYSFEVESDRAFMYATPRIVPNDFFRLGLSKAEISGVVSAVIYDSKQKSTVSIVCFSEQSSSGKPPKPSFSGSSFTCPKEFASRL